MFPLSLSGASWCSCSLFSWSERTLSPLSRASWCRCCVCRWCHLSFPSRIRHTCIKVIRVCPYSWTSCIWSFPFYWTPLSYSLLAFFSWPFSSSRNRLSFTIVNNDLFNRCAHSAGPWVVRSYAYSLCHFVLQGFWLEQYQHVVRLVFLPLCAARFFLSSSTSRFQQHKFLT